MAGTRRTIALFLFFFNVFRLFYPAIGEGIFRLRIVHTNDMHARFMEIASSTGKCSQEDAKNKNCFGGFARVRTALLQETAKAKEENVAILRLNAGDTFQGTVWYTIFKWRIAQHFMNMLPFDAASLGNHEFDDGVDGLVPYLKSLKIPIVLCNLDISDEPKMAEVPIRKSVVLERGGQKIGVIGYVTTQTLTMSNPGNIKFTDEYECIKKEAQRLHDDGIKIIIALGHSGLDVDIRMAQEIPHLDVIVGGHTHTFLYSGTPPSSDTPVREYPVIVTQKSGRIVPIVQAYAFTKYIGKFEVTFDDRGEVVDAKGNPILLDHHVEQDPEVLNELKEWRKKLTLALEKPIGLSKVLLDGSKCRFSECNLGNLMADAFVHHAMKNHTGKHWTIAAIAIQQGGGVRSTINVTSSNGTLTAEDVMTAMPFYTPVSVVKVTGQTLMKALEWSVARYNTGIRIGYGEFLQMSGIHVTYNLKRNVGSRVVSVRVRCAACDVPAYEDLNLNAEYNVVMSTFIFRGGDNHTAFKENGTEILKFDTTDTEIVMQFLNETPIVYTGVEDRIVFSSGDRALHFQINLICLALLSYLIAIK